MYQPIAYALKAGSQLREVQICFLQLLQIIDATLIINLFELSGILVALTLYVGGFNNSLQKLLRR